MTSKAVNSNGCSGKERNKKTRNQDSQSAISHLDSLSAAFVKGSQSSERKQDTHGDFAQLQRLILNAKGGIATSVKPYADGT